MGLLLIDSIPGVFAAAIGLPGGASVTLALAALTLVSLLVLAIASRRVPPQPLCSALRSATRQRSDQALFLRLRDPDAAGRPRPRAPSVQPTAG